jgi:hypothetical protein
MRQSSSSDDAQGSVTHDEAFLLQHLKDLLAARRRAARVWHKLGAQERARAMDDRLLIRDCISKLRLMRAGVSSMFLGLGQREWAPAPGKRRSLARLSSQ